MNTWVARDMGDTWMAKPQEGLLDTDLTILGEASVALVMVDSTSILADGALASFVLGDTDDPA